MTGAQFRAEILISDIVADHNRNGGSSFSIVDGTAPIAGFMVSLSGYERRIPYRELTPFDVRLYIEHNVPNARRLHIGPLHVGTWWNADNDTSYLDLSVNVADKGTALQIARDNKQLAIYDVANRETITV